MNNFSIPSVCSVLFDYHLLMEKYGVPVIYKTFCQGSKEKMQHSSKKRFYVMPGA